MKGVLVFGVSMLVGAGVVGKLLGVDKLSERVAEKYNKLNEQEAAAAATEPPKA